MRWNCGGVIALGVNEFPAPQEIESGLHSALGQAGFFGERAEAGRDRFPFRARRLAVEPEVNQVGSRLAIVADDIAHQNVEHVIVDRNGLAESGHDRNWDESQERFGAVRFFFWSLSPKRNFTA